jgi:hypothetical protein
MRRRLTLALVLLAACSEPHGPFAIVPSGTYVLQSVDGEPVPAVAAGDRSGEWTAIVAETLVVNSSSRGRLTHVTQAMEGDTPVGEPAREVRYFDFLGSAMCASVCTRDAPRNSPRVEGRTLTVQWLPVGTFGPAGDFRLVRQ